MTDQELLKAYQKLSQRVENLEKGISMAPRINPRTNTALTSLGRKYLRFCIISTVMVIASIFYARLDIVPEAMQLPLCLSMMVYFLTASLMDYWLYIHIRDIDVNTMSVSRVIEQASLCRRRHLQFMAVLIIMCVALLALMVYTFVDDTYVIAGMAFGAIIGLGCGSVIFMRMMRNYRQISGDE